MSLLEKRIIDDARRKAEFELDRKFNEFRLFVSECLNPFEQGFGVEQRINGHIDSIKNIIKPDFLQRKETEAIETFYLKVRNLPD